MTKPNFQVMSRKQLRAYVLAHRDDDEAFYAYADKIYESIAAAEASVFEWLKLQNPHQAITKIPEKSSTFVLTDREGNQTRVKVQFMRASLPTHKPFIELFIEDMLRDNQTDFISLLTVFVSKNETEALELDSEITEANFNNHAKSSWVVGYVDLDGKFNKI